jgi:hypothetical protein
MLGQMSETKTPALPPALSPALRAKLGRLFTPEDVNQACDLLQTGCGNALPLVSSDEQIERIRSAVLKMSCGSLTRLIAAIAHAQADWRDTLVGVGFADDARQHLAWLEA